jgi:hypothetical protein
MVKGAIHERRNAMEKNVGGMDKTIRIIVGIVLLIVGVFVQMGTGLRIASFVVAAIALVTAFAGF